MSRHPLRYRCRTRACGSCAGCRLFAAAPDLLEACSALLALSPLWPDDEANEHAQAEVHAERLDEAMTKARAAIAKARGGQ